jgi:pimeloyl-ACP methyl ester carboxylesterase
MRALEPAQAGFVERNGARIGYEVFGEGASPTLLLMPTFAIVHARMWKMLVPYLARHYRVVTWDGVGNGLSDRPADPARYSAAEHVADALAVLEATETGRVIVLGKSTATHRSLLLAAEHAEVVAGLFLAGPKTPLGSPIADEVAAAFLGQDVDAYAQVFMRTAYPEPHSSKAIEDGVGWAGETDMATLKTARLGDQPDSPYFRSLAARVQ